MAAEDANLLDELLADSRPGGRGCAVCHWLEGRDDAAIWDAAFQNDLITTASLGRGMRKRGFTLKDKPAAAHRREGHRVA